VHTWKLKLGNNYINRLTQAGFFMQMYPICLYHVKLFTKFVGFQAVAEYAVSWWLLTLDKRIGLGACKNSSRNLKILLSVGDVGQGIMRESKGNLDGGKQCSGLSLLLLLLLSLCLATSMENLQLHEFGDCLKFWSVWSVQRMLVVVICILGLLSKLTNQGVFS
jgi:hypothetical protein